MSPTNPKEYWQLIKELYGTKVKSGIHPLIKDDVIYSSPLDKCRIINEHFANKSKLRDQLHKPPEINVHFVLTDNTLESLQFTEEDVRKVIKNLDTAKATGPDGISNTMLKKHLLLLVLRIL